jgi:hypothetical protein
MAASKSTAKSARRIASKNSTVASAASIQLQLRAIAVELRYALSTVAVTAHTLREQNADLDTDVAILLQRGAGAPLHAGLGRIETLLGELNP